MSSITTVLNREDIQNVSALMGIPQDYDNYNALIEGSFLVDKNRNKNFSDRIKIKDDRQITRAIFETETTSEEELDSLVLQKTINSWLLTKEIPSHTNEYIALKRKEHILTLLTYIEKMRTNLDDFPSLSMYFKLFLNEISVVYKNFLKTRQDENFLSILNLLEEIFHNNQINKKLIKAVVTILKSIKDLDTIDYSYYENAVRRLFNLGIDFISIKEIANEK